MYSSHYVRGQRPHAYSSRPPRHNRPAAGSRKQYINPAKFIHHEIATAESVEYTPTHKFDEFGFNSVLLQNVTNLNYVVPTAIQDKTIPLAMSGRDVVGLANTGTGKTAAFVLPILNKLYGRRTTESVLIMAPTRELAQQINEDFKKFAQDMKLYSTICVGGANIDRQIRELKRRPHVIIGTPGRLKDLLERRELHLDAISTLVLDEADRMLDMGFVRDIRLIINQLPEHHQTMCFSATITSDVARIIQEIMSDPVTISVVISESNDHIYQDAIKFTSNDHKRELLAKMLTGEEFEKVIIFGETKFGVQRLSDTLTKMGISSVAIHGNKNQNQRERALKQFKNQEVRVLVATDVAARGLDIPNVSHVINFDTPNSYEDYIHRIGRTGRAGKTGIALTFVPAN